jgi:hypothetical protein
VFEERAEGKERVVGQGCHFGWFAKKKREETGEEEEKGHLAEIHLNFEKFKSGPRGGGGLLRSDLLVVETILQVFRIFKQVEKRFW